MVKYTAQFDTSKEYPIKLHKEANEFISFISPHNSPPTTSNSLTLFLTKNLI